MANFGQNFLAGFTEVQNLRDYTHASKTFTTNAYELKPKFKFLFHVSFTLNIQDIPALKGAFSNEEIENLGLVVKTADLPKFNVQNETLNQYNRKRVVQTKVNYDPVTLTFHDDSRDLVRKMWYNYFSYYYKDPTQQYLSPNNTNGSLGASMLRQAGFGYNARDIYSDKRVGNVNDWGYIGESYSDGTSSASGKPPFFRDIRIYGMDQHRFSEYILINPLITNWSHDQYDYAQGNGIMQNSMTVAYETVKYYAGAIGASRSDVNVQGFADPAHYDTRPSPIARAGSTSTVFGQGGLLDAGQGIIEDLQSGSVLGLIGATQKASTAYNTFKGKNLKSLATSEATAIGQQVLVGALPGAIRSVANKVDGWLFPTSQKPAPGPTEPGNL
jgi:hypothetical protein